MPYTPYVPQNLGELHELLAHMLLASPTFKDKTGYFPRANIDTAFFSLNEGLLGVRKKLGEERYATLRAMSDRMKTLFESDPQDKTGATRTGHMLIHEMDEILTNIANRKSSK